VLMLLAKLSAARPLRPDMEMLFEQDQTRISRFIRCAMIHIYMKFAYTLSFDTNRLRSQLRDMAYAIGESIGVDDVHGLRIWGFVDGTFRKCARPKDRQDTLYNGHYGGHGFKYQVRRER
jgi:hypothetical protein